MPVIAVASPIGDMSATGTGTIDSQRLTLAAHTGITHEFRMSLSKTSDIFTAFSWADTNTEGAVDASSGLTNFTIALDEAKFAGALKAVIEQALGGKANAAFSLQTDRSSVPAAEAVTDPSNLSGGTRNAQTILDREVRLEVEAELDANGVLEYLEGDSLGYFNLALDASGGAVDLATKLAVSGPLRNLFLQFPNRSSEVGLTDASGSRLPVAEGDAVAFVFNVSPSVNLIQRGETTDADSSGGSMGANGQNTTPPDLSTSNMPMSHDGAFTLVTGTRKIAFVVEVTA
jgi:hypothetical protein